MLRQVRRPLCWMVPGRMGVAARGMMLCCGKWPMERDVVELPRRAGPLSWQQRTPSGAGDLVRGQTRGDLCVLFSCRGEGEGKREGERASERDRHGHSVLPWPPVPFLLFSIMSLHDPRRQLSDLPGTSGISLAGHESDACSTGMYGVAFFSSQTGWRPRSSR